MEFDPALNAVSSTTKSVMGKTAFYCTSYDPKPTDPDHQFAFNYPLWSLPAFARTDQGHAFQDRTVNVASSGDQLAPRVAMSASGSFVVAWEDDSSDADDVSGKVCHDVKVRGFKAGGCGAFSELVVNATTAGNQQSPDVAMDAAGNFVVAWADDNDLNGYYQIYARGFTASGASRFSVIPVNGTASGQQVNPAVGMAADGRFVVAWEDGDQIKMRGFHADGTQSFADRTVNSSTAGKHLAPALALASTGRVYAAWRDDSDDDGVYQIRVAGFTAAGVARTDLVERNANVRLAGQKTSPSVGVAADGRFAVAWASTTDLAGATLSAGRRQIYARGFDATGVQRIAELLVPGDTDGNRVAPALAMQPDGAFVVVWQDDGDDNGSYQIRAAAFAETGAVRKGVWTVNREASGQQVAPHVGLSGGEAVFAFQDDMDGNGFYELRARGVTLP
jgi:hypothetical protein